MLVIRVSDFAHTTERDVPPQFATTRFALAALPLIAPADLRPRRRTVS